MQSKQQKQIKVFLIQTFGGSRGGSLFSRQEKILDRLIKTAANRSKNQMKTLVQTILPRIALYKVLQTELPAEETFTHMRTYMMDWVAAEKHAFTVKMESVPGFYRIYSYCFLKIMRTSDLWESTQEHDKTHFSASSGLRQDFRCSGGIRAVSSIAYAMRPQMVLSRIPLPYLAISPVK